MCPCVNGVNEITQTKLHVRWIVCSDSNGTHVRPDLLVQYVIFSEPLVLGHTLVPQVNLTPRKLSAR